MVLKGKGKFKHASAARTGIIYIPSEMVRDSQFPFEQGEKLDLEIEGEKLIVKKAEEK